MKAADVHTPLAAAPASGDASFSPMLATLAAGVGSVTIALYLTLSSSPAVGVILGFVVMSVFVVLVLTGMQRLLGDEGPDE